MRIKLSPLIQRGSGEDLPGDEEHVIEKSKQSSGCGTHPTGKLRWEYATYGKQEANFHIIHRKPFDIEEYFQCFLEYRQQHLKELRDAELKVY